MPKHINALQSAPCSHGWNTAVTQHERTQRGGGGASPREITPADGPGGKSTALIARWPSHLAVSHFLAAETIVVRIGLSERRLDFLFGGNDA